MFGVIEWLVDFWDLVARFLPGYAAACLVALEVATLAVALSLVTGFVGLLGRGARHPVLRLPADFYVWFFRGTPQLVQVYIVYYGLPQIGISFSPFVAGVLALGVSGGAYVTEVLRSGLAGIPRGQGESALALGMGTLQLQHRIILPQVVRITMPALISEAISTLKNTSLVSMITVVEIMLYTQKAVAETFAPIEFYIVGSFCYLGLNSMLARFSTWYERRYSLKI